MVNINILKQQGNNISNNFFNTVDGRIKLFVLVFIIIFAVSISNFIVFLILELFLIFLIILSGMSFKEAMVRILLILPFGFFIIIFQPVIHPGHVLYTLPLGFSITREGIQFAELLMARFLISITSIVLFSYITPIQEIAKSLKKLGLPNQLSMIFILVIRFVFLFYEQFESIQKAQTSRGFSVYNNKISYKWKVKQISHLFFTIFLQSYEQGEKVFTSMLSRGYNDSTIVYNFNKDLTKTKNSLIYLISSVSLVIILEILSLIRVL